MNELFDALKPELLNIAVILLTALASWVGVQLNAWLHAGKTNKEYTQIKSIINDTVDYVEQVASRLELNSEGKLDLATKTAAEWLTAKGFKVSPAELNVMIEATVKNFYNHWDDIPEPIEPKIEPAIEPKVE